MDRMQYEMLIRRAFNCGRGGVYGAEAGIFDSLVSEVAIPLHGESPQPNFNMGLAMGEVITWMKAAFHKIHDDNIDNDKIRKTMNECIEILGEPTMENIDKAGDSACALLNIS